jgi:uncharacterized membrane protein YphA (DoxX/SURF4 family)
MTSQVTVRSQARHARGIVVLGRALAVLFVAGGAAKFLPGGLGNWPSYADRFAEWGYPSWVRFFVGTTELIGAALLLMPRRHILAAAMLIPILIGAVVTHIINSDPIGESVAAPMMLILMTLIAYKSAPWNWHDFWESTKASAG